MSLPVITIDFETYYDQDYSLSKMSMAEYIRDRRFRAMVMGFQVDDEAPGYICNPWMSHPDNGIQYDDMYFGEQVFRFFRAYAPNGFVLVAHNAAFDAGILSHRYGIKPTFIYDTLSMARPVVGPAVSVSLDSLTRLFGLGEKGNAIINTKGKILTQLSIEEQRALFDYCLNDVVLTRKLFLFLRDHITDAECYSIDTMIRMFTEPVLELNQPKLQAHLKSIKERRKQLLESVGPDNLTRIRSNKQFAEWLTELGVEPPTKTNKKGETTYAFAKTDQGLLELQDHEDIRVQTLVMARLGLKTSIEETRTKALLDLAEHGAWPIALNYYGANTGRASGGDGVNPQNLPARSGNEIRDAVEAPEGHIVIAGDSSQIEARMTGWLAGQDDLVADFANGVDIYCKFASKVYDRPITKADTVERFVGKTCILGLGYGMGHDKLKRTLKIGMGGMTVDLSLDECARIVAQYRSTYDKIRRLWKDADLALTAMCQGRTVYLGVPIKIECTPDGVRLPNGMMIRYPNLRMGKHGPEYDGRKGPVYIYGAKMIENIVQALARIIVFDQMNRLTARLKKAAVTGYTHRVVLTVHDEIVAVVPLTEKDVWVEQFQDIMSKASSWAAGLPVACGVKAGKSYGQCK